MGWNEPGGGRENDPWGGRRGNQRPPDLDEIVRKLQDKFSGMFGGRGGRGGEGRGGKGGNLGIGVLVVLLLGIWLLYDMSYVVQEGERGVVLRFGRYVDTIDPGLNFRLPRPIETVYRVNVKKIETFEIGFRKGATGVQAQPVLSEALMLTQDENIVQVHLAIQHRIKDAQDYLFNVRDPERTLREAAESAIRETIGKNKLDFIITEGRTEIAEETRALLQTILDRYQTGILVTTVNMQQAQAPQQVQAAFDDAAKAREDKVRQENEAEAYSNDVIPKARGGAARRVEEAKAYRDEVTSKAEGEASRFTQVLKEYKAAPNVTRERLYIEAIQSVLEKSGKVVVDVKGGNNILYLPLDRLIQRTGTDGQESPEAADGTQPSGSETKANQQHDSGRASTDRTRVSNSRLREVR